MRIFVGRQLEQIYFSSYTIDFSFDGNIIITLLSSFEHKREATSRAIKQKIPLSSTDLLSLLGKRVVAAKAQPDGTMTLEYEGGQVLKLFDDSSQYESYTIRLGDRDIVV